jgi:hypothetical protein
MRAIAKWRTARASLPGPVVVNGVIVLTDWETA